MKLVNQQIIKNQFTGIYKIISEMKIYTRFLYGKLKLSKEEIKSMNDKETKNASFVIEI